MSVGVEEAVVVELAADACAAATLEVITVAATFVTRDVTTTTVTYGALAYLFRSLIGGGGGEREI